MELEQWLSYDLLVLSENPDVFLAPDGSPHPSVTPVPQDLKPWPLRAAGTDVCTHTHVGKALEPHECRHSKETGFRAAVSWFKAHCGSAHVLEWI